MYTKFFNLKEKPFNLVPNPNYLYASTRHQNALSFLEYGLSEKIGFVMLTGEIGIGKTTLIRHLLNKIDKDMDVGVVFNTNVVSNDLIYLILNEFEVPYEDGISKAKALDIFYRFLIEKYAKGRNVLLVIDEAQNLSHEVLEEVRMLSNLQTDEELLIQIMIVGQPNLREMIENPKLEQFAQRISVSYHLAAMDIEETKAYIAHRISKAGGDPCLFPSDVVKKIHEISGGIPRTINLLCDAVLVYAYADNKQAITLGVLDQVVEEKGGLGIFTKERQKTTALVSEIESVPDDGGLLNRVVNLEQRVERLAESVDKELSRVSAKSERSRDELIDQLKTQLQQERVRYKNLVRQYKKICSEKIPIDEARHKNLAQQFGTTVYENKW
ncbi:AAA family ATPase [uncultured Desulfobacter sp.]|uniref:ExeA family protein n=1 Tax=uncultured Desulfobacter sp. TaxID=240139 RepID=UPI0029F4C919|nr:AAA family ATPase [uncultured Desulfobacter sp.]